ncbi:MAG: hypothetical protein V4455_11180, partial [Pseudomonadota bacterium]
SGLSSISEGVQATYQVFLGNMVFSSGGEVSGVDLFLAGRAGLSCLRTESLLCKKTLFLYTLMFEVWPMIG